MVAGDGRRQFVSEAEAAVDHEVLAVDVPGEFARQEHYCPGDVCRIPDPPGRDRFGQVTTLLLAAIPR
jgi:hypothetical protein